MSLTRSKGIGLLVAISFLSGCGGSDDPDPVADALDRAPMLTHWVDNIIIPAYDIFNGKMEDSVFATFVPPRVMLGGYTVVNIGGSFKVNETVELFGRIENLFDRTYQEVYGFNTPGLTAFGGLKATF